MHLPPKCMYFYNCFCAILKTVCGFVAFDKLHLQFNYTKLTELEIIYSTFKFIFSFHFILN